MTAHFRVFSGLIYELLAPLFEENIESPKPFLHVRLRQDKDQASGKYMCGAI